MVNNTAEATKCVSCETPKPGSAAATPASNHTTAAFKPPTTNTATGFGGFGSTAPASTFSFGSTPAANGGSFGAGAEAKKKDSVLESPVKQSAIAFGSAATPSKPDAPAGGFSFGAPKDHSMPASTGFAFGSARDAAKPAVGTPAPTFSFGQPPAAATPAGEKDAPAKPPTFSFSAPASDLSAKPAFAFAAPTTAAPSFGLSALPQPAPLGGFQFAKPPPGNFAAASGTAPAPGTEEGEGDDAEPPLPQADLTKGEGEENESTLFQVKSKIYTKDDETKEWKVYGVGILKINKGPEATRILCRAETGKILANFRIYKGMVVNKVSDKRISSIFQIDGVLQPVLVNVGNPGDCQKLIDSIKKASEELK
ncbi:hypothetical protein HDV03_000662 [Kappamyces sp. JEL0829]|nr:hypothetical protein HDV03_000662 [Kappamyces sp. JEL0829]